MTRLDELPSTKAMWVCVGLVRWQFLLCGLGPLASSSRSLVSTVLCPSRVPSCRSVLLLSPLT